VAVEPKQTIEKLASQHKPFDVFLRFIRIRNASESERGLDVPEDERVANCD